MEFTLLGRAVAAALAVSFVIRLLESDERLGEMALGASIAGLIAGRLTAMVSAGSNPLASPLDIVIVRGGVSTWGASIGALLALAWLARRDTIAAAAALGAPVVAGLAAWHGSCVLGGACLGTTTSLPWGMAATAGGPPRHPVEIYAALILAVAAVGVALARRRQADALTVVGFALAVVAGARLVTEPLRLTIGGGPWPLYALGTALGAGIVLWSKVVRTRSYTPRDG